ncbi:MAG: ATP-dependent zinc protease [Thiotrichales bacterium]
MEPPRDVIGWREWVAVHGLDLPPIKAKVDTGARTSCLHAYRMRGFKRRGVRWVRFHVHPLQHDTATSIVCEAPVVDRRWVADSGGHRSKRYVIEAPITLGGHTWKIEITLTSRDTMLFRMLLGRSALRGRFLIDPQASFVLGGDRRRPPRSVITSEDASEDRPTLAQ